MLRASLLRYKLNISSWTVFVVFVWTNLVIFVDRGIIPGSTIEFNNFIVKTTSSSKPDVLLGLLQSSFIIGYVFGSLLFGHLVSFYGAFRLTTIGLGIWTMSLFFSAFAYVAKSYTILLLARIVSGFGEASLQCNIPPWFNRAAPPGKAAGWLGLFYTAIPVGTALGYVYSASISSSIGWPYSFFFLAISFIPVLLFLSSLPHDPYIDSSSPPPEKRPSYDNVNSSSHNNPTVLEELNTVLHSPIFLCICFAGAAQSAVLIGLSTFGSAFVLGLGYYNTEAEASAIFGILISIAGIIATPAGGYLVDKFTVVNSVSMSEERKKIEQVNSICGISYWLVLISSILYCLSYYALSKALFLSLVTIASAFCFATNAGAVLAQISTVEPRMESFALAVSSFIQHALGDVPSPIIAGYLKDYFSPGCASDSLNNTNNGGSGSAAASAACRAQGSGLRMTMFLLSVWLFWAVLWFGVAWHVATSRCLELQQKSGRGDKSLLLSAMRRDRDERRKG